MYINVGMANRENDPNKNRMTYASHTLPYLHLFLFTFLRIVLCVKVCVLLEHVCMLYTGSVGCGCWKQVSARWSPVNVCAG